MAFAKMIGIDTNIILSLFDRTNDVQFHKAKEFIAAQGSQGCFISSIVFCELAWTLARTYKKSRSDVHSCLAQILDASEFKIENTSQCERALVRYRNGKADFADYYLAEVCHDAGCNTTYTFNVDAGKSDMFTLMKA